MRRLFLFAFLLSACGSPSPKPDLSHCDLSRDPWEEKDELQLFPQGVGEGGGVFGRWVPGALGLVEYDYTLNEEEDPRALWVETSGRTRRDHLFFLGNRRLNVIATSENPIEVYLQDRGIEVYTRYDPETRNYGAGWSLLRLDPGTAGEKVLPFLSGFSSFPLQKVRRFGIGYLRRIECDGVIRLDRILWIPQGTAPVLISEVRLTNVDDRPHRLEHYEVWDVNRIALEPHLVRSGTLYPGIPASSDRLRRKLNTPFLLRGVHLPREARLTFQPKPGISLPPPDAFAYSNSYPFDAILHSFQTPPEVFFTDGRAGWDLRQESFPSLSPDPLPLTEALDQPGVLVARSDLSLKPGESRILRYAFALTRTGESFPFEEISGGDPGTSSSSFPSSKFTEDLLKRTAKVVRLEVDPALFPPELPYAGDLSRELTWHAGFLENAGGWQEYFQHFIVNQGSAYLYLHGADGAVRDFVLTALPLIYISPDLAREILLYSARMRHCATGGFSYAVGGYGYLSSAVIHFRPSDLDLFYFLGIAEYIAATGDLSILDAEEPLWPRENCPRVPLRDHLRIAWNYLTQTIGLGPHRLVKLGSGDWDDSITFFAKDRSQVVLYGESVANSALASFAVGWLGSAVSEAGEKGLGEELLRFSQDQSQAVAHEFTGRWYRRAWFDPDHPFGDEVIFLFPNALALIANIPDPSQAGTLIENLDRYLARPSTTSLIQFYYLTPPPGVLEGATDQGSTNPAITALGVWGISHYDWQRAFLYFLRNTMVHRARVFPELWYGIWSGPDAYYTSLHPRAGESWASPVTPMKDLPVFNSNYHLGPLLSALRLAGVEPVSYETKEGPRLFLGICPRFPPASFKVSFPLLKMEAHGKGYTFRYNPPGSGRVRFLFCLRSPKASARYQGEELKRLAPDRAFWEGEIEPQNPITIEVEESNLP